MKASAVRGADRAGQRTACTTWSYGRRQPHECCRALWRSIMEWKFWI